MLLRFLFILPLILLKALDQTLQSALILTVVLINMQLFRAQNHNQKLTFLLCVK
nr:unnamed protein product [Callosobruchus chinensis]